MTDNSLLLKREGTVPQHTRIRLVGKLRKHSFLDSKDHNAYLSEFGEGFTNKPPSVSAALNTLDSMLCETVGLGPSLCHY